MNLADGRLQVPPVEVTAQLAIGSHTSCGTEILAPYESRVSREPASSAQNRGAKRSILAMLRTEDPCTGSLRGYVRERRRAECAPPAPPPPRTMDAPIRKPKLYQAPLLWTS